MRAKIEKIIVKAFRSFDITKEVSEIENLYKKQSDLLVKHTVELSEALIEIEFLKKELNILNHEMLLTEHSSVEFERIKQLCK